MKVLQINNVHYRRGGADAVYLNTAELLQEHGHEVVFFNMKKKKNIPCKDELYWVSSVESRPKGVYSILQELRNFFYNPEAEKKIEELIVAEKPDIAHVHLFYGMGISPAICKVLKKYRIPLVHTVHDYRMICANSLFMDRKLHVCERCNGHSYYKAIIEGCSHNGRVATCIKAFEMYYHNRYYPPLKVIDGFIFVSNFAYEKHLEFMPGLKEVSSIVLYNFAKQPTHAECEKEEDYFLYYGRISYEKGIPTLLKVFAKHPELKLKVVGTGPLEKELREKYEGMSASGSMDSVRKCYENIQFLGYRSGEALDELVRSARFVCVPSEWYENNPMTIIEAYSVGTPVIGARIGGIPEIVDEGRTGFTFKAGNADELDKIITMASRVTGSKYENMRKEALAFYGTHFSSEQHYEKLVSFYQQTIERYEY